MKKFIAGISIPMMLLAGMGVMAPAALADTQVVTPTPAIVTPYFDNLGQLIVLDGLFGGYNGIMPGSFSRLGRLIVLDDLFGSGAALNPVSTDRLGRLIVLDGLFGHGFYY